MTGPITRALLGEVARVKQPITKASGMPNAAYSDPGLFEFERDQVLGTSWAALAYSTELVQPGYMKPIDFMGLPLLMVRDKQNNVEVFHNVCSHRGMELVAEEGPTKSVIQCRYHSWCYGMNGDLKATPHIGGVGIHEAEGFSTQGKGLKKVRSNIWLGMIFINLSGNAETFDQFIAPLVERWSGFVGPQGLDNAVMASDSTLKLEVQCNWKLAIENYCESYHLPWVHPGLNSYSPLDQHYNLIVSEGASGQGSRKYTLSEVSGIKLPAFAAWPSDRLRQAEYVSLYPNVLLGVQADHVFTIILHPKAHNLTREKLQLLFVGKESLEQNFQECRKNVLDAWQEVFSEDIFAIESMQRGRNSPAFTGGKFTPVHDVPTHHFHSWVADKYLAGS